MKELQRRPRTALEPAASTVVSLPPLRMAAAPAADQASSLKRDYAGVLEYWQMVRRHKLLVVLTSVLGCAIGFILTLPEPRMYQSRITLEIQGLNGDFLNMRNISPTMTATSNEYPDYDIQTQARILQSRSLLRRVSDKIAPRKPPQTLHQADRLSTWRNVLKLSAPTQQDLWKGALGAAAGNVRVRASGTSRIVEITCDSTNPWVAAEFLNVLAKEYIEENLEARWKSTEYTGMWLSRQIQDLKINLEKAEDQLQRYANVTGLIFTDGKVNVNETRLEDIQKQVSVAQADRVEKQSKYETTMASRADALPDVLDNESLKATQQALAVLKTKLAQLRVTFTVNHPEVRSTQAQITSIEGNLEAERANILTRIKNDFEAALRREKLLVESYEEQAQRVSADAGKTAHYSLLKREVDANRTLYESMLQKLKEASVASALRASNIRVVDAAEPPGGPYKPDAYQRATVGLFTGLFLGVITSVMKERADRTLQDPGDASFYLGVPELGVVPEGNLESGRGQTRQLTVQTREKEGALVSEPDWVELVAWNQKSSLMAESFRTCLTSILFSGHDGERPRLLVLTSASPKEGKTTVVSNLAISLAEINQRVLLIDGDMRRPRMHNIFGVPLGPGFSDLLAQKAPLDDASINGAIKESLVPGLSLMTGGNSRTAVSSLLHSDRLPELLATLRDKFDTVLIDTPPMVNIADSRVIGRFADGLIMVVRSGFTTRDAALLAKQRFAEDGLSLLGTILNGWNPKTPGYSYYRYYYAGYYHYYGKGSDHEKELEAEKEKAS